MSARTKLLAGTLSKSEAAQAFTRTRLGGPRQTRRFDASYASYAKQRRACSTARDAVPASCVRRAAAADTAARRARAAMKDWADHLANMAAFRRGDVSAAHAQHRWVTSWRAAPADISRFSTADAALRRAPACPASA